MYYISCDLICTVKSCSSGRACDEVVSVSKSTANRSPIGGTMLDEVGDEVGDEVKLRSLVTLYEVV